MLSPAQIIDRCSGMKHVPVTLEDREQMAIGLFLQGYSAGRAGHLAFVELGDDDGALQMLARHRIAAENHPEPAREEGLTGFPPAA